MQNVCVYMSSVIAAVATVSAAAAYAVVRRHTSLPGTDAERRIQRRRHHPVEVHRPLVGLAICIVIYDSVWESLS